MTAAARRSRPVMLDAIVRLDADPFAHLVAKSDAMQEAIDLARRATTNQDAPVLIIGESGTGKDVLARAIHRASSPTEPFVVIHCAAMPDGELAAELFGQEHSALTGGAEKPGLFEHARAGTLFLAGANQLTPELQSKLLRVLETKAFCRVGGSREHALTCRVIAGANVPLELLVAAGRFRSDLFYRFSACRVELPPLRMRPMDIVPLAEHFLRDAAARRGVPAKILDENAKDLLRRHSWPGNAREVRSVIERASVLAAGEIINPAHLKLQHRELMNFTDAESIAGMIAIPTRGKSLEEIEREAIRLTMILTAGNLSAAARILGISRPTLARKMRDGGITRRSLLASS
jgi:DNA-binding NtrC family response regulator